MKLNELTAISPIDGRYRSKTLELAPYFSEYGLIRYRIKVEIEYFISLAEMGIKGLDLPGKEYKKALRKFYEEFTLDDAERVKEIEKTTNHDVKAVEYFLKEKFEEIDLSEKKEFIHFALTSQDINNTAVPLSFRDALTLEFLPLLEEAIQKLDNLSGEWSDVPMLARTHGQPASPTRLGKEIEVFSERLKVQFTMLQKLEFPAKFGGATGNFNAHHVAYPGVDWNSFADRFVKDVLGLSRSRTTTQIDHYDRLSAIFDNLSRINVILIDLCRDFWFYISLEYFRQKIKKGEVGSSTMPHKVNPIDFENAEGNLGVANTIYRHLSEKLPISRLQRDLTDSTVLRNIGVPLAHSFLAIKSLLKGLDKLIINRDKLDRDLDENWVVVGEAIQTILRRESFPDPYEALKELTRRNARIDQEAIHNFIDNLDITEEVKKELKNISPKNYTGL